MRFFLNNWVILKMFYIIIILMWSLDAHLVLKFIF